MFTRPERGPSFFSTMAGRRLVRQAGIVLGAFVAGYLITVFWLFPAPFFSSDHAAPRVLDDDLETAKAKLERQGFRTRIEGALPDPTAPKGAVIWQDPAPGTSLPANSQVQVMLSDGPNDVLVPDVIGFPARLAARVVKAAGLQIGRVDSLPSTADPGVIVTTRPASGVGRATGSPVDLVVSSGPAELIVPTLTGLTLQQARERLQAAGLRLGNTAARTVPGNPGGTIIEQHPAAGTLITREGRVDIILARKTSP